MNDLLNLIANIIVFGLLAGLINAFLPMPASIKSLLNIVILVVLIVYVLQFFGVIHNIIPMYRIVR